MNRILDLLRGPLVGLPEATDRHLLDRFLAAHDETAFAELVRRHGRLVWGVCNRRLANHHDAEDAFQATFLVLLRRAGKLGREVPLGPWLHRVAVMTARNVVRGNSRRAAVTGPMEHEVPDAVACADADRLDRFDLDAAVLALPERYRVPVVLCHLQGLSRREAADRLGCPEGTLSSLLNRALVRLRTRLGGAVPAMIAVAVPAAVSAATVRAATILTTSTLTAAGVSPTVAGLTDGVLRMFWVKKLAAGVALAVVVAGGVFAGLAGSSGDVVQATEPLPAEAQTPPDDPDAAAKRLEKRLTDLQKQKELLDATLADLQAEKAKLEETKKAKAVADAAAELGKDIAVSVGGNRSGYTYTIREVVNGKVAEIHTSDLGILEMYLTRAFRDPKGPKKVRISAHMDHPMAELTQVFAACAAAGFTKASFSHAPAVNYTYRTVIQMIPVTRSYAEYSTKLKTPEVPKPGEIDLTKYAPKKP